MQKSIRFPDDVAAWIEQQAKELDRSFSWVVINAVKAERDKVPRRSPEDVATYKKVWDSPALMEQMLEETAILDAVSPEPGRGKATRAMTPARPLPPGVKSARELAMERQRRMNERKS